MSQLIPAVPTGATQINVPGSGNDFDVFHYVLFTVPPLVPSRIESVTFRADYLSPPASADIYEITLKAKNGAVLDRAITPIIQDNPAVGTALPTWVRQGNDLAQSGWVVASGDGGTYETAWWRGSMADMVLQDSGTVNLSIYRVSDGGFGGITLSEITVTYTPSGQGTAQVADIVLPLLTPTDEG